MPPPNMFVHLCRDGKCAPAQLAPLTHEAPASRAAWRSSLAASAGGAGPRSLAHLTPEAFCGLLQAPRGACPPGRARPLPPRAAPTHAARELSTGHLPALTSARRLDGAWPRPLTRAALLLALSAGAHPLTPRLRLQHAPIARAYPPSPRAAPARATRRGSPAPSRICLR